MSEFRNLYTVLDKLIRYVESEEYLDNFDFGYLEEELRWIKEDVIQLKSVTKKWKSRALDMGIENDTLRRQLCKCQEDIKDYQETINELDKEVA